MKNYDYDVIVLGAGPGGYVAAIKASQLGCKTAIIEKDKLGGICLNWGCIPTKALLRTTEILTYIKNSEEFGIKCKNYEVDFFKIIDRSRKMTQKLSSGIEYLLKKNQVTVIKGSGKFLNKHSIIVQQNCNYITVTTKYAIIATGARAKFLDGLSPQNSKMIMGYKEALIPEKLPNKLLIIGGGAIGVEFASFYNTLGTKVTIMESANRILVNEDKEVSLFAHKCFKEQGIEVITSAIIRDYHINSTNIHFNIKSKLDAISSEFDAVISSVGITANIQDIGLETINVKVSDKNYIIVDDYLKTHEQNIYAIGDVIAPPWLAHKASYEGVVCSKNIVMKNNTPINRLNIPGCTYSYPQIASVGLTQEKAEALYGKDAINIGRFPLSANSKALICGDTNGFIKTIFHNKTGELLGAHTIGPEVTEMIYGLVLTKHLEGTELDLMNVIFPHPTLSEAIYESVLNAFNQGIHI